MWEKDSISICGDGVQKLYDFYYNLKNNREAVVRETGGDITALHYLVLYFYCGIG